MNAAGQPIRLRRLGRREYAQVLELQREMQQARRTHGPDHLLLVEHEPVFTLGRAHTTPKLRVAATLVEAAGIPVIQTERGGDITYHGPGQLVAYCIIDLRERGIGAADLVTKLEECAIRTAAAFGVEAARDPRNRGAWASGRKLASIGINVRGGVSMHGIAFNVDPDMDHFALIEPCGLPGVEITSLARELGTPVSLASVQDAFLRAFGDVFECEIQDVVAATEE